MNELASSAGISPEESGGTKLLVGDQIRIYILSLLNNNQGKN
jgi:hypothetical protein